MTTSAKHNELVFEVYDALREIWNMHIAGQEITGISDEDYGYLDTAANVITRVRDEMQEAEN